MTRIRHEKKHAQAIVQSLGLRRLSPRFIMLSYAERRAGGGTRPGHRRGVRCEVKILATRNAPDTAHNCPLYTSQQALEREGETLRVAGRIPARTSSTLGTPVRSSQLHDEPLPRIPHREP